MLAVDATVVLISLKAQCVTGNSGIKWNRKASIRKM